MYDPILGRMLSPDNYVPTPYGTQGYNRYTYALNNPLKYTDPDGNYVHLLVGALIGSIVNVASGLIQGNIHNFWDGVKAAGIGAVQGALGAAIGYGGFGAGAAANAVSASFTMANSSMIMGSIASGIGSSFIPTIPFGDNFSISPAFAFGSKGLSAGLNANARFGKFSLGVGFSNTGNNRRFSYGGGFGNFSYYRNKFYGDKPQTTGTIGFNSKKFNLSWENDRFGGSHDRWRTNGMGVGYNFKNGSSLFVGSRFMTGEDIGGQPVYSELEGENAPREGLFYLGYTNTNGVGFSAGVDSEKGLHRVQDWMHDRLRGWPLRTNDWYFPDLQKPVTGFYRFGNVNPFTYYY